MLHFEQENADNHFKQMKG